MRARWFVVVILSECAIMRESMFKSEKVEGIYIPAWHSVLIYMSAVVGALMLVFVLLLPSVAHAAFAGGWMYPGHCYDALTAGLDGRTALQDAVYRSYPHEAGGGGILFLAAAPNINTGTGVLAISEKLNVTTATASTRTILLAYCTDETVECKPSERTIAPCPTGMAPAQSIERVKSLLAAPYQDVFGSVPVQDIGAVALIALSFVVGFSRGLKS
jgi:hypothetical protein